MNNVITKVFKWLGPIAIPLDIYDAWEDEPDTTAGMIHGTADFLAAGAGSMVGGAAGGILTAGNPWGAAAGAYIGGEIAPEFIEAATLGTWFSIQHFFSGTTVADYGPSGIPDLDQFRPPPVEQAETIHQIGPTMTKSSSTIISCPLGKVMVNGRCEDIN